MILWERFDILQNYSINIFVKAFNDIHSQKSKKKLSFGYGWTLKVSEGVKCCDIEQITDQMEKRGIETDFAGNKVIAWCSQQAISIFNHLNKEYGLKLDLPKSIFVEDFSKLKLDGHNDYGICNWYPSYLKEHSEKIYPEKTVFFNSFGRFLKNIHENQIWKYNWQNIDQITEELYKNKIASSNHFLYIFIHELCHSAHNGHLFQKFSPDAFLDKIRQFKEQGFSAKFKEKYGNMLSSICDYAALNPLEAIATDMSVRILRTLDLETLKPRKNPFRFAPYPQKTFVLNNKNKILSKSWKGEISI